MVKYGNMVFPHKSETVKEVKSSNVKTIFFVVCSSQSPGIAQTSGNIQYFRSPDIYSNIL